MSGATQVYENVEEAPRMQWPSYVVSTNNKYYFCRTIFENNRKREIIGPKRNYAKYKFRSLWLANNALEIFSLAH